MPDESGRVIFSGEFDSNPIKKGADEIVGSLNAVKEANEGLKATTDEMKTSVKGLVAANKELTGAIKESEVETKRLEKEQSSLNKATADGRQRNRELTQQIKEFKQEQSDLASKINANGRAITDFNSKIKTNEVAIKQNAVTVKTLSTQLTQVEKAAEGSGRGLNNMYGFLRKIAYVIPGIGIGGLVALIAEFGTGAVAAFFGASKALDEFQKDVAIGLDIQKRAAKDLGDGYGKLELIKAKLNDLSIPEAERLKVLKEYNKTADEANKIDATQINNLDLINSKLDASIKLLKERAFARAAEAIISEKAEAVLKKQIDIEEKTPQFGDARLKAIDDQADAIVKAQAKVQGLKGKVDFNELLGFAGLPQAQINKLAETNEKLKVLTDKFVRGQLDNLYKQRKVILDARADITGLSTGTMIASDTVELNQLKDDLARTVRVAAQLTTTEGLTTLAGQKTAKGPENVFLRELARLKEAIAAASAKEFQSDSIIEKEFKAKLDKELLSISEYLKKKELTKDQAEALTQKAKELIDLQLTTALDQFHKKQRDALDKINEEIATLNDEAATKRIANIRDNLERERQNIDVEFNKTIDLLTKTFNAKLKQINEDAKKGLISPDKAKQAELILSGLFGDLLDEAGQARINRQIELAYQSFESTIKASQDRANELTVGSDENVSGKIADLSASFLKGEIKYKKYQDDLTKILRDGKKERDLIRKAELEDELASLNDQIAKPQAADVLKKLQDQQTQVRGQLASLNNEINEGAVSDEETASKKRIDSWLAYLRAAQEVLNSIIGFWQQVNAAEAASLDRTIALQQKRVDNAQRIADKGNADYLEQEQKRLDALQQKREDNARKQLALNNALTLSNATVAAIGAIAQAVNTGGALAAIGAIAAIIGVIGAAFNFVNSLNPPVPTFAEGTEMVRSSRAPKGKDKVPAMLDEGERVVRARDNKSYWDTLHAIHSNSIPPEVLNNFVNSYPDIAVVDYQKLSDATNNKMGSDSFEVVRKLDSLNDTMGKVVAGLSGIGLNVNLDEKGLSAGIGRVQRREALRKHS